MKEACSQKLLHLSSFELTVKLKNSSCSRSSNPVVDITPSFEMLNGPAPAPDCISYTILMFSPESSSVAYTCKTVLPALAVL